jgi:hypothetical protein
VKQLLDWLDGLSLEAGLAVLASLVVSLVMLLAVAASLAFGTGREDRAAHDQTVQSLRGSQP